MALILKVKGDTKGLGLKDILPAGLEHGMYDDAYRLQETDSQTSAIVFDPKHIGRGVSVEIAEDGVELGLTLAASRDEIELVYRLLRRACRKLDAKVFYKDGQEKALEDIEAEIKADSAESKKELEALTARLTAEKDKVATIFGALNPIAIGAADVERMEGKLDKFGKFLHNKQMANAYYSAPQFFQDPADGSFVGVYNIMVGMNTIMPFEPSLPFYMHGEEPRWYVYVYVSDDMFGYVKFDDFIKKAPRNGFYDVTHFFCTLTEDMAEQLIKNYGAEV